MQRIYEWRASFGSSAICILNAFFECDEHKEEFITNNLCIDFSKYMLKDLRFLYSTADGDDRPVRDVILTHVSLTSKSCIEISWTLSLAFHPENIRYTSYSHRG
jgi:hypothetical protein